MCSLKADCDLVWEENQKVIVHVMLGISRCDHFRLFREALKSVRQPASSQKTDEERHKHIPGEAM
jgi:hypothetical protein